MRDHDVPNGAQLASTIAPGVGESYWPQPELGLAVGPLDMNMGRLRTIPREEVEAVRTLAENGRRHAGEILGALVTSEGQRQCWATIRSGLAPGCSSRSTV